METKVKAITIGTLHNDLYFDKSVSISFDNVQFESGCEYKVLVQIEPPTIINIIDEIIKQKNNFDLILSWHPKILKECENSILFPFGSCWIDDIDRGLGLKNKLTSIIASNKKQTLGHQIRHEVIKNTQKPIDVYGNGYKPIENKKVALKEYMFSLIIENDKTDNWFTEKLIDCMVCGTIPIYWGCGNIGQYFDKRGMICCDSAEEIVNILPTLDRDKYMEMLPYLSGNLEKSLKYADFWGRVENKIKKTFNI